MATKKVRALLNSASFPMVYAHAGRSILDNNDLNARMPGMFYGSPENAEFGIPQLLYCENVLPMAKGVMSVTFRDIAPAHTDETVIFDQAIILRDSDENVKLCAPAFGSNLLFDTETLTWSAAPSLGADVNLVTRAFVNGRTFLCYEGQGLLEYDQDAGIVTPVTLNLPVGYTIDQIRGIGGASNYLLLFTELEVLWSSPLDVLDFADIDEGSGNQIPTDLKGRITSIMEIDGGFIIYTARNAVAAFFTNNARAPFAFKEVPNCGGVISSDRITGSVGGGHFVWSSSGLQRVTKTGAESFAPDVVDFLVGHVSEDWDPTLKQVVLTEWGTPHSVKLNYVNDRYLFISYGRGENTFNTALVLDTILARWGKVKIEHADIFMYPFPPVTGELTYDDLIGAYSDLGTTTYAELGKERINIPVPKQGIAFLGLDGSIKMLIADYAETANSNSVAIFGKFQIDRTSDVSFLEVETENLKSDNSPQVTLLLSLDGTNQSSFFTIPVSSASGALRTYGCRKSARNGCVAIEGTFTLSGLYLEIMRNGSR